MKMRRYAEQLLEPCEGERTEAGMRALFMMTVRYIEAWISGNGLLCRFTV